MSSGADCNFTEFEPGRWKYNLQQYPYGETTDYDTYGPFRSFTEAHRHLQDNHQNPGGYSTATHPTHHVHEFTPGGWRAPKEQPPCPTCHRPFYPAPAWDETIVTCETCNEPKP